MSLVLFNAFSGNDMSVLNAKCSISPLYSIVLGVVVFVLFLNPYNVKIDKNNSKMHIKILLI